MDYKPHNNNNTDDDADDDIYTYNKLCAWRHDMPRPSPPPWAPQHLARRRADAT